MSCALELPFGLKITCKKCKKVHPKNDKCIVVAVSIMGRSFVVAGEQMAKCDCGNRLPTFMHFPTVEEAKELCARIEARLKDESGGTVDFVEFIAVPQLKLFPVFSQN
ncbi:MAG: hypothetical protein ABI430_04375 [Candidatus Taylorbacteria bacterium]